MCPVILYYALIARTPCGEDEILMEEMMITCSLNDQNYARMVLFT